MGCRIVHLMTLTIDRSWAVIFTVAVLACLLTYWQANATTPAPSLLPEDLGLQLEDVGVGVGDQGNLPGAQPNLVAVPVM